MQPFLLQFADKSSPEPELIQRKDIAHEEVIDANSFHTRCGHPRTIDD